MNRKITAIKHFNLRNQNSYFGGWPVITDTSDEYAIVISFPVEGWQESAAVVVGQDKKGELSIEVFGASKNPEAAINQALATMSLDINDEGWEKVGKGDEVIHRLQEKYQYLRPVLFHSPYEAAAGFIIGQRISIKQCQLIQNKMAEQLGVKFQINGQEFSAFPMPQTLLDLGGFSGLNTTKIERLHGIARAALSGRLNRAYLTDMSHEQAIDDLQKLAGVGPFYASGILYRGAGIVDGITDDSLTKYAIQQAYSLEKEPTQEEVIKISDNWRPYRMWCEVLIHVWLRREVGLPRR